ncbi:MAG: FtsW/RodA/SpoVE family cell cycle protein [Leptolinea sp.]|nr:FtsW/RodA/SpoVE family cell cycle protein [Leptolinea sp.]
MNRLFPASSSYHDQVESRLFTLAGWFLFFYSLAITLSPAARMHSWQVAYRWDHWAGYAVWLVCSSILFRRLNRILPDCDPFLFPLVMVLSGWGLLEVWRLSGNFGIRQAIWLLVCTAVLFYLSGKPVYLNLLRRYKYLWLAGGLVLTALTFVFGTYPGGIGPHLWLGIFGVYLQPSEPLKLLLIVYLSAYLGDLHVQRLKITQWLMPALIILAVSLLILLGQRDLGTATIFILIFTFIIYLATGRRRTILISLFIIAAAGILGYQLFDVIRVRVDAWINPWLDPSGRSYQIVQSIIAIASGGVFGHGPGLGSPGIIPVAQSDFIFSAIAEETGLIGVVGLLAVVALIFSRGLVIAVQATDTYRRNLAAGISIYLVVQSIFIIGGNLRLLPLSGVTLPFISYGGSSLLTGFIGVWMLLSISNQSGHQPINSLKVEPYLISGGLMLTGLVAASLVTGWWAVVRSDNLTNRVDNPRRSIAERYVKRGSLLDRAGQAINRSVGISGEYQREYLYPGLAATTGYAHPIYGLSSLEEAYDEYLRGLKGNPSMSIWTNQLLYGQPPAGLDIRLSIDTDLQKATDQKLEGKKGAIILLNAQTGEILAISSQPGFDPNTLEKNWLNWTTRQDSPLINRVTQGVYPIGTAISPFILAAQSETITLQSKPEYTSLEGFGCALNTSDAPEWGEALRAGCPGAVNNLLDHLSISHLEDIFESGGFYQQPELLLPQAAAGSSHQLERKETIIGSASAVSTPLQMALAAASISANGIRPAPRIAMAVNTPSQGWVILPAAQKVQAYSAQGVKMALSNLSDEDAPYWYATSSVLTGEGQVNWFVGGTTPEWQGTSLALVVVVEGEPAQATADTGIKLLNTVMMP